MLIVASLDQGFGGGGGKSKNVCFSLYLEQSGHCSGRLRDPYPVHNEDFADGKFLLEKLGSNSYGVEEAEAPMKCKGRTALLEQRNRKAKNLRVATLGHGPVPKQRPVKCLEDAYEQDKMKTAFCCFCHHLRQRAL